MSTRSGCFASARARFTGPMRLAAVLAGLALVLPGCSAETRQLLQEEGSHKSPSAEVAFPSVFQPKPKDPPKVPTAAERQALKGQLLEAGASHKTATEAEIARP